MPTPSGLAVIAELGDLAGIDILQPRASDWHVVLHQTLAPVITPDTVARFEYRNEVRVPDYPMERGAFAAFNRVQVPFDIRMLMVCSGKTVVQHAVDVVFGNGSGVSKSDFLGTLETMLDSLDLYDIVTPDRVYSSCSLVHYDYRRESSSGATLLLVEAWFQEIRETASAAYAQTKTASAASPVSLGSVRASAPTTGMGVGAGIIQ